MDFAAEFVRIFQLNLYGILRLNLYGILRLNLYGFGEPIWGAKVVQSLISASNRNYTFSQNKIVLRRFR